MSWQFDINSSDPNVRQRAEHQRLMEHEFFAYEEAKKTQERLDNEFKAAQLLQDERLRLAEPEYWQSRPQTVQHSHSFRSYEEQVDWRKEPLRFLLLCMWDLCIIAVGLPYLAAIAILQFTIAIVILLIRLALSLVLAIVCTWAFVNFIVLVFG